MKTSLVVTTISLPTEAMQKLAYGCRNKNWEFIVIGDVATPKEFKLDDCFYYDVMDQSLLNFRSVENCPKKHYARKNLGYLQAMKAGAEVIVETDDDNYPLPAFWEERNIKASGRTLCGTGWINVYRYFTKEKIWPRGLPLDCIDNVPIPISSTKAPRVCPIQQGLVDLDPDVDAIYRMTHSAPVNFDRDENLMIAGNWFPFNSQNTTWFRQVFELMYLPSYCSSRVTDIWRSFVTQRVAWENEWFTAFTEPTMYQKRNPHNLIKDLKDELPLYLYNRKIASVLDRHLMNCEDVSEMMRECYLALVKNDVMDKRELDLLDAWLEDVNKIKMESVCIPSNSESKSTI